MTRTGRLRLWAAWGGAALAAGLLVLAVVLTSDHQSQRAFTAALALVVSWSFVVAGLAAWSRRPANHTGRLLVWVGFSFLAGALSSADNRFLYTVGEACTALLPARARRPGRRPRRRRRGG